jgi:hypothetical protein
LFLGLERRELLCQKLIIFNLKAWISFISTTQGFGPKVKIPDIASSRQIKREDRALFNKQQENKKYIKRKTRIVKP